MSRPLRTLMLLCLFVVACGNREVSLEFHTPEVCCPPESVDPGCTEPECPLANVRSVLTQVERVDLTLAHERCRSIDRGTCRFEDLDGLLFTGTIEPQDGAEVLLSGFDGPDCGGEAIFSCDSFGDHTVDLTDEDIAIPLWCSCPLITR